MNKLKLVLGTLNRLDPYMTEEELEEVYERSYKPFLMFVNDNPSIRVVCYYSGSLLDWLEAHHKEFIILLRDLSKKSRIEFLLSGYYEPIFPFISAKYRSAQIEKMSTRIRSLFNKKGYGGVLFNNVWEPTLTSTFSYNSIRYLFLPEIMIMGAEIPKEQLMSTFITEDQGKVLGIMPIHTSLVENMGIETPEKFYGQLLPYYMDVKGSSFINLLLDGNSLGKKDSPLEDFFESKWIQSFYDSIKLNKGLFDLSFAFQHYKNKGLTKKIYLNPNQSQFLAQKMFKIDQELVFQSLNDHLAGVQLPNYLQNGFFRQFLIKYKEANDLYSKILFVENLINQSRHDKNRQQEATNILLAAQRGDIYCHAEDYPGIYHSASRKKIYADLLESEKMVREKGIFKQNLIMTDYDFDGIDEFLFSGQNYNTYIHPQGGEVFELDYFPAKYNYLDTMTRYQESYLLDTNYSTFDQFSPNLFCDFFFQKDFQIKSLNSSTLFDTLNSDSPLYTVENWDKKSVSFSHTGSIVLNGMETDILLTKEYQFKKGIELTYSITNLSNENLNFQFGSLLNFAFTEDSDKIQFLKIKDDLSEKLPYGFLSVKKIDGFIINDQINSTQIDFFSNKRFSLSKETVNTPIKYNGKIDSLFQQYALLPLWNVSIRPNAVWKLEIILNLAKK